MKLRSTAAVVLLGWNLMCPPLYHPCWPIGAVQEILGVGGLCESPRPHRSAPQDKWIASGAYNSAEECQSQAGAKSACKCVAGENSNAPSPAAEATPVGYYLMTPPMVFDKGPKTGAPLDEWSGQWDLKNGQQRKPYATLDACEARKAAIRREYLEEARNEAETDADLSKLWVEFGSAYAHAQCVQSDDPRLN